MERSHRLDLAIQAEPWEDDLFPRGARAVTRASGGIAKRRARGQARRQAWLGRVPSMVGAGFPSDGAHQQGDRGRSARSRAVHNPPQGQDIGEADGTGATLPGRGAEDPCWQWPSPDRIAPAGDASGNTRPDSRGWDVAGAGCGGTGAVPARHGPGRGGSVGRR
ncbi:MAG: hypothetical protein M5U01_08980 [Ardenticatenaceae bacterium]|nr:hypothetical protein [Ardenticatenaceae bacterium]